MALGERLLPVLRRVTTPRDGLLLGLGLPGLSPVCQPHGDWLHVLLVEDRDDALRFVQHQDLERADLTEPQAFELARLNLGARAHEPAEPLPGGVRVRDWGGYASSLPLLEGWWRAVAERVDGTPLAFAPDVDELLVVGSEHPDLDRITRWAFDTFRTTARPLSPAPLGREGHSPRNARLLAAFTYAEQDEVLLRTAPEGVYVAGVTLHLGPDGSASTRTRCEPGHVCWLPETDEVEAPEGRVPFGDLALERVEGVHPARYRWSG